MKKREQKRKTQRKSPRWWRLRLSLRGRRGMLGSSRVNQKAWVTASWLTRSRGVAVGQQAIGKGGRQIHVLH